MLHGFCEFLLGQLSKSQAQALTQLFIWENIVRFVDVCCNYECILDKLPLTSSVMEVAVSFVCDAKVLLLIGGNWLKKMLFCGLKTSVTLVLQRTVAQRKAL